MSNIKIKINTDLCLGDELTIKDSTNDTIKEYIIIGKTIRLEDETEYELQEKLGYLFGCKVITDKNIKPNTFKLINSLEEAREFAYEYLKNGK